MATIGIDLGTTYSCVAGFREDELEIIQNDFGKNTTPSYVAFDEGEAVVGETAKGMSYDNPHLTIFDVKRMIGKRLSDPFIQNYAKLWPFKLTQDKEGKLKVITGETTHAPEEISSKVLATLRHWSEEYLGQDEIKKAVVTIPAYFNEEQKELTRKACSQAGLEALELVPEPVAAAIAYNMQRPREDPRNFLIFDLGGGTFDVAIVTSAGNRITIQSVHGDPHLGGEDMDNAMVKHCLESFQQKHGVDLKKGLYSDAKDISLRASRNLKRIKMECEKQKCFLSVTPQVSVDVGAVHEGIDLIVPFKRELFESLSEPLFQRCLTVLEATLKRSGFSKENIDEVVLVGGSTRIPRLQQILVDFFGKPLTKNINPDEVVAWGAAMLAHRMDHPELEQLVIDGDYPLLPASTVGQSRDPDPESSIFGNYSMVPVDPEGFIPFDIYEDAEYCYRQLMEQVTMTRITSSKSLLKAHHNASLNKVCTLFAGKYPETDQWPVISKQLRQIYAELKEINARKGTKPEVSGLFLGGNYLQMYSNGLSYVYPFTVGVGAGSERPKHLAKYFPDGAVSLMLHLLGKRSLKEVLKGGAKHITWPFPVRESGNYVSVDIEGKRYSPEEVLSIYLDDVVREHRRVNGEFPCNVIAAVPTHFSRRQRFLIRRALHSASLNCVYIIDQPVAAVVSISREIPTWRSCLLLHLRTDFSAILLERGEGGAVKKFGLISKKCGDLGFDRRMADYCTYSAIYRGAQG